MSGLDTVKIPLRDGREALIDAEDFCLVGQLSWLPMKGWSTSYAKGWDGAKHVLLHRLILDAKKGQVVDHRNGDGLDNRKANLRLANGTQNNANQRVRKHSRSGVKGVQVIHPHTTPKFRVRIRAYGVVRDVGVFDSMEAAVAAHEAASRKAFGEFAFCESTKGGATSPSRF